MKRTLRSAVAKSPLVELPNKSRRRNRADSHASRSSRRTDSSDSDLEVINPSPRPSHRSVSQRSRTPNEDQQQQESDANQPNGDDHRADNQTTPVVNSPDQVRELARLRKETEELARKNEAMLKKKRAQELEEERKRYDEAKRIHDELVMEVPADNVRAANEAVVREWNTAPSVHNNNRRVVIGSRVPLAASQRPTVDSDGEEERFYTPVAPARPQRRHRSRSPLGRKVEPVITMDSLTDALDRLQTKSRPVVLKKEPPIFDGKIEGARLWLKQYEGVATINRWTDVEKSQYLSTALTGNAKRWFDGLYDGDVPE